MLLLMSAIVASTVSDPVLSVPPCVAPPKDASETCIKCYEDACEQYILEWMDCDGNTDCMSLTRTAYYVRLVICECDAHASIVARTLNPSRLTDFEELLLGWVQ